MELFLMYNKYNKKADIGPTYDVYGHLWKGFNAEIKKTEYLTANFWILIFKSKPHADMTLHTLLAHLMQSYEVDH